MRIETQPMPVFGAIDWTRSWYASISDTAEKIVAHTDWRTAVNERCVAMSLTNHRGLPISFVAQAALPEGTPYEAFISATGRVPTRDNLHDFLNALVWLSFPRIKRKLNALQAIHISQSGIGESRGTIRDAATLFDENAALLVVADNALGTTLIEGLQAHQWHSAFVEQRRTFNQHASVWLFGHALMEKLAAPYKAITAHAWPIRAPEDFFAMSHDAQRTWLDMQVSTELAASDLSTARFTPLPVLGVPGWWPAQDDEFYDDAAVFRAKRHSLK